mmetsp:Transcript_91596/g.158821  ORF Transcript_91596/g.158821 Transcript_91596/m.158821 type:complete len:337 (-) Transcript_91596:4785-5795(-)
MGLTVGLRDGGDGLTLTLPLKLGLGLPGVRDRELDADPETELEGEPETVAVLLGLPDSEGEWEGLLLPLRVKVLDSVSRREGEGEPLPREGVSVREGERLGLTVLTVGVRHVGVGVVVTTWLALVVGEGVGERVGPEGVRDLVRLKVCDADLDREPDAVSDWDCDMVRVADWVVVRLKLTVSLPEALREADPAVAEVRDLDPEVELERLGLRLAEVLREKVRTGLLVEVHVMDAVPDVLRVGELQEREGLAEVEADCVGELVTVPCECEALENVGVVVSVADKVSTMLRVGERDKLYDVVALEEVEGVWDPVRDSVVVGLKDRVDVEVCESVAVGE